MLSGGMVTKLAAARIAIGAGCRMAIADGRIMHPIAAIAEGARCSWFLPTASPRNARKKWIAGSLKPVGSLTVDDGALQGARVRQEPAARRRRRVSTASSSAAMRCACWTSRAARWRAGSAPIRPPMPGASWGTRAVKSKRCLGYRGRDEMIHRDDLVVGG